MIHEITDDNFDDEVRRSELPWVIDFTAGWCTLCEEMRPRLETLSRKFEGDVRFGEVNTDEQRQLRIKFAVGAVPYVVYVSDGNVTALFDQIATEDQLEERIRFMLDGGEAPNTRPLR